MPTRFAVLLVILVTFVFSVTQSYIAPIRSHAAPIGTIVAPPPIIVPPITAPPVGAPPVSAPPTGTPPTGAPLGGVRVTETLVIVCATVHTSAMALALASRHECGYTVVSGAVVRPLDGTGPVFGDCGIFSYYLGNMGNGGWMFSEMQMTSWFFPISSTSYMVNWYRLGGGGDQIYGGYAAGWNPFAIGLNWFDPRFVPTGMGFVQADVIMAHEQLFGGESCDAPFALQANVYITA